MHLKKNKILLTSAIITLATGILLLLIPSLTYNINSELEYLSLNIFPHKIDDSVVIININAEDIDQLGPYPLKRSYYALLINELNNLKAKKIGLEIFLSAKISSQLIYDNLLLDEVSKDKNVVLSSVCSNIYVKNSEYHTDSLSYPSIKLLDQNVNTGHINFINNDGCIIPSEIKSYNEKEQAFYIKIAGFNNGLKQDEKINFYASSSSFKSFSITQFFNLLDSNKEALNFIKGKNVIIGIGYPELSKKINTPFEDDLPGLYIHAFALDNLLSNSFLNDNYYSASGLMYLLLIISLLIISIYKEVKPEKITLYGFIAGLFSIFIFRVTFIQLNHSLLLIPSLISFLSIVYMNYKDKKSSFKTMEDERDILSSILKKKEDEILKLQLTMEQRENQNDDSIRLQYEKLLHEVNSLKDNLEDEKPEELNTQENIFEGIVYRSNKIEKIIDLVKKVAPENAPVLIAGESGTGKELIARAIHNLSLRKDKKLIIINCGALSENLLESELFGYVKGAFTGANLDKKGRFEIADGSTLFLDEIGETTENFQIKLLRVLQYGEFEKVGSSITVKTDVRIIAATNKDLKEQIKINRFREDLFFRLNVINIELPPLRERKEDIPALVKYLLKEKNLFISHAVSEVFMDYNWPGNIRELYSIIERASILSKSSGRDMIQLIDLPSEIRNNIKLNIDELIIESLQSKKFSHSSIIETSKELGDLNRNFVSEHFRGYCFMKFYENNFELDSTSKIISNSDDKDINSKVKSKLSTFIKNVEDDLIKKEISTLDEAKSMLSSKYKNLPSQYHLYLDYIITHLINTKK